MYKFWLLLCAAGCMGISFYGEKLLPAAWIGKLCGICACALMTLLSVFSFVTGDTGLLGLTDPDKGQEFSRWSRRIPAAAACMIFLAGTAAETAYAFYSLRGGYTTSLMGDALMTAAIYTAASLTARKLLTVMAGRES